MPNEHEKMLAGELYDPLDADLVCARQQARDLCWQFNAVPGGSDNAAGRNLLQQLLAAGGDTAWIQPPFFCDYGSNIYLGREVFFNFNCVVLDVCTVQIGSFTKIGPAVQIYTAAHPMDAALRRQEESGQPIRIGDDVWIGGGAIVCPGVAIGDRAVIGAGSVVTRDIPADVFAAGNPCRVIRRIDSQDLPTPKPPYGGAIVRNPPAR